MTPASPSADSSKAKSNIHRQLFAMGYELNFAGLTQLTPRVRYIAVQYDFAIRQKLKDTKGEAGWGSVLAMEEVLEPVAVLQFYPCFSATGDMYQESTWFVALAVPRRQVVYGFEKPIANDQMARLMVNLRTSSFHGPDTNGMQFYKKAARCYFTKNPFLQNVWEQVWNGFQVQELASPLPPWPGIADFISDAQEKTLAYPALETKPKTVNPWDGAVGDFTKERFLQDLRTRIVFAVDPKDLDYVWEITQKLQIETGLPNYESELRYAQKLIERQYQAQSQPAAQLLANQLAQYRSKQYQATTR